MIEIGLSVLSGRSARGYQLSTNPRVADPFVELDWASSGVSLEIWGDASKAQIRHGGNFLFGGQRERVAASSTQLGIYNEHF